MKVMKHTVLNFADGTGLGTVLLTFYMNITEWLNVQDWNKTILFLTSFFGLIYLILKVYYQLLVNRKLRLENKKKKGKK